MTTTAPSARRRSTSHKTYSCQQHASKLQRLTLKRIALLYAQLHCLNLTKMAEQEANDSLPQRKITV